MALVKCWNSIKINTNKMFTSTIEGLFVFFLQWGDPFLLLRENTGALRVKRNPPQAFVSMHKRFHLNDLCAAQGNSF